MQQTMINLLRLSNATITEANKNITAAEKLCIAIEKSNGKIKRALCKPEKK